MKRDVLVLLLALGVLAVLFFTSTPVKKAFMGGFHESYKKSYVVSFKKSCEGPKAPPEKVMFCDCSANAAVKRMSVSQLMSKEYSEQLYLQAIMPQCIDEVKAKTGIDMRDWSTRNETESEERNLRALQGQ